LLRFISSKIGSTADDIKWNEEMLNSWLPLNIWVETFFSQQGEIANDINPLALTSHLKKVVLNNGNSSNNNNNLIKYLWEENDYLCPIELSEDKEINRIFSLSRGAIIKDGTFISIHAEPSSFLGSIASLIPFPEHSENIRLLFGADLMKMALMPANPEQPYVQTDVEPPAPDSWYGFNLLTGFISNGIDTHEDGVVISESCARKMRYNSAVMEGDLLFSRHGYKGVISKILPDSEMPCLWERPIG